VTDAALAVSTRNTAAFFRLEGAVAPFKALDVVARLTSSAPSMRRRLLGRALTALGGGLSLRTPLADPRAGARLAWATLEGISRDRVEVLALDFAQNEVLPAVRPEARRLLSRARTDGARTVLVSDGIDVVAREVARALGIDHVVANTVAFEDDLATGALVAPVVGPELDPSRLAALAREWGIDLARSSAYGANEGDGFLLSHVGRPCAICPDRGLSRVARDLGWPIVLTGGDGA
jgi:HAD superfamily phosphoserine phosphatase-like hydrolase